MAGYLHEGMYRKALARLYMLGNKPYRGGKGGDLDSLAANAGGLIQRPVSKAAQGPKETPDYSNVDPEDVQFIKGNRSNSALYSPEFVQEEHIRNLPPADPFKIAEAQQKMSDQAVKAPMNGRWTQSGVDNNIKKSNTQLMDYQTSQALMSHGGVLSNPYGQPGMMGTFNPGPGGRNPEDL